VRLSERECLRVVGDPARWQGAERPCGGGWGWLGEGGDEAARWHEGVWEKVARDGRGYKGVG